MPHRAFLDADVLVPARLRDVLLTLAEVNLFTVSWSRPVLDEVVKNLPDTMRSDQVDALLAAMGRAFPEAEVEPLLALDPRVAEAVNGKDHHVVAAALSAGAHVLVTDDRALRDQVEQVLPARLDAQSADVFLAYALDVEPALAVQTLVELVRERWGHRGLDDHDIRDRLAAWAERNNLVATAGQLVKVWATGQ